MECTFQVGDKVTCVDSKPRGPMKWDVPMPVEGAIYTITSVVAWGTTIGVHLAEIPTPAGYSGYYADRFRPLVTTKTDISLFQKILEEASKEAKEKV